MNKQYVIYGWVAVLCSFLMACAQINPLQGGPKDATAPQIDSARTYPLSGQTNFSGDEVVLKFKEFVRLANPNDNIIITPQFKNRPEITAKNKKVTIAFQEPLEENTTYTISFNRAIQDITESNDSIFQFVFSTGSYIDSLHINGRLTDGFTNQPKEIFLVGLYLPVDTIAFDSIPFKTKPVYIAQSDQGGRFEMNYLKEGDYYLFAFDDANKNLKLNNGEALGFWSADPVHVSTENESFEFATYLPPASETKLTTTRYEFPGRLEFIFSLPPDSFAVTPSQGEVVQELTGQDDSLVFWLKESPASGMNFFLTLNDEKDTIKPLYKGIPDKKGEHFMTVTSNLDKSRLLPGEGLKIIFSEPLKTIDQEKIHFYSVDTVAIDFPLGIDTALREIAFPFVDSLGKVLVKIDSGAATSVFGTINKDVPYFTFENYATDYYGSLTVNVDTVFQQRVIAQLLNEKNEVIQEQPYANKMLFENVLPASYQLRLVIDENEDGKWTGGSLVNGRQPEKTIYNSELIQVKSKWEKEVDWFLVKE